jgi:hypothetical protein
LCSDEFGPLARAESQVLGIGALPLIALPHPLAGNDAALVAEKAAALADEVIAALTGSTATLTSHYAERFVTLTERRLAGGAVCIDPVCVVDPAMTPGA